MGYVTVSESITAAKAGAIGGEARRDEGKIAQVAIAAGRFVCQGTADRQCNLPGAAGAVTETGLGIAEYLAAKSEGTSAFYDVGEMVSIVRKGYVWVPVEDAVAAGQTVFVRITADTGGPGSAARTVGAFRSDGDSGEAIECTRAIYRTTQAAVGGLALVEINLP